METKTCTKCSEVKAVSEFYKASNTKSGRRGSCKSCSNKASSEYVSQNAEAVRKYKAKHYQENADAYSIRAKVYAKKNAESLRGYRRDYFKENKNAIYIGRNSSGSHAANQKKRQAAKLQRTPQWADMSAIAEFYVEAKRLEELTGIKFHVDHIVPLQGELVSGLHVPANLQLLTAHDNQRKYNSFAVAA